MMSERRDGASDGGEQKDLVSERHQGRLWEMLSFENKRTQHMKDCGWRKLPVVPSPEQELLSPSELS